MTANLTSPLGPGAEFDKIRAMWAVLGDRAAGGGDDCAIVQVGGERLALSTDMHIEGVHFLTDWLTPFEIGWRATSAALSDLAAVAAEPQGLLVSLGLPPERSDKFAAEILDGAGDAAASAGAHIWGGDLVRAERVTLDVAVVGTVSHPVLRSGASAGDVLWVTGRLGGPQAAIDAWKGGAQPEAAARDRFAHPTARVREARWLADRGAKAMIDLSDGLLADAGHLAAASGVRCAIELERVPVFGVVRSDAACVSGEEFELLVALPDGVDPAARFESDFDLPLTRVGRVEQGSGVVVLRGGLPIDVPRGFQHF